MDQIMLDKATAIQEKAYVPYSKFKVGCCIKDSAGQLHVGCNVENAAYPIGHCAEKSAIAQMVGQGALRIKEIVVVGSGDEICAPCGGCRQALMEFADADTLIHLVANGEVKKTLPLKELLPYSFGPQNLEQS